MIRNFFGLDEETSEWEERSEHYDTVHFQQEQPTRHAVPSQKMKSKVISMNQRSQSQKASIHVIEPRVFTEAERIADYLLNNDSVLLNFKRMEKDQASKVIDFIAGAVYAVNGDIQQVGEGIFLCTPANFEIANREVGESQTEYYF